MQSHRRPMRGPCFIAQRSPTSHCRIETKLFWDAAEVVCYHRLHTTTIQFGVSVYNAMHFQKRCLYRYLCRQYKSKQHYNTILTYIRKSVHTQTLKNEVNFFLTRGMTLAFFSRDILLSCSPSKSPSSASAWMERKHIDDYKFKHDSFGHKKVSTNCRLFIVF